MHSALFRQPRLHCHPSGELLNYSYNGMGMLSGLSGTNTYLSNVDYNTSGQVIDQKLGNTLIQQYCYNDITHTQRLMSLRVYPGAVQGCTANPSNPSLSLAYTYQPNGNISQVSDVVRSETIAYTYDELDRLLSASGPYNQSYTYGTTGNLATKTANDVFTAVSAGNHHTCGLTTLGGVKCWGHNAYGQLGDNSTTQRLTPVSVSGLTSGVTAVAAGSNHTCALTAGGGVKCWGNNLSGQLGDGTTTNRTTPVDVSGLTSGVIAISAGESHTCALTTTGGVKCWGYNGSGQLGTGLPANSNIPVQVSGLTGGVAAITAGAYHTCALLTGGGVKCWGYNIYGQLGMGDSNNRILPAVISGLSAAAISAGQYHTCALTTGGAVMCWGSNSNGQLGDNSTTQRLAPVGVSGLASGVSAISAGQNHTCALTMGGGVKCWG